MFAVNTVRTIARHSYDRAGGIISISRCQSQHGSSVDSIDVVGDCFWKNSIAPSALNSVEYVEKSAAISYPMRQYDAYFVDLCAKMLEELPKGLAGKPSRLDSMIAVKGLQGLPYRHQRFILEMMFMFAKRQLLIADGAVCDILDSAIKKGYSLQDVLHHFGKYSDEREAELACVVEKIDQLNRQNKDPRTSSSMFAARGKINWIDDASSDSAKL